MKINILVILLFLFSFPVFAQNKDTSIIVSEGDLKNKLKTLKQKRAQLQTKFYKNKNWSISFLSEIRADEMYNAKKHFFKINDKQYIGYTHIGNYIPAFEISYRDKWFNEHSIGFSIKTPSMVNPNYSDYKYISSRSKSIYYTYDYLLLKRLKTSHSILPSAGARIIYSSIKQAQEYRIGYYTYFIDPTLNTVFVQLSPGLKLLNKRLKLELGCNLNLASVGWGDCTEKTVYYNYSGSAITTSETKKISNISLSNSDVTLDVFYYS